MQAGSEAECIMDCWVLDMIQADNYGQRITRGEEVPQSEKPDMLVRWFSDIKILGSNKYILFLFPRTANFLFT